MKIALAVHHFPPRYTSGAERQAFHQAQELLRRGHEVRVICVEDVKNAPTGQVAWVDEVYEGLQVRRLSIDLWSLPRHLRWEYDNHLFGDHFTGWLSDFQPDVFHLISGYLLSGSVIHSAKNLNIPTIVSLMDMWFLCRRLTMLRSDGTISTLPIDPVKCARCLGEERRSMRWLGKMAPALMDLYWHGQRDAVRWVDDRLAFLVDALCQVDLLISNSHFLADFYQQQGIPSGKMVVLRQGYDAPSGKKPPVRPVRRGALQLGYLGQITEIKGVHVLVKAVRSLAGRPVHLKIYGDEQRFPDYTSRLVKDSQADPRIEFCGSYNGREHLQQILGKLDMVVVPSIWYENSPNVILEAFAYGVPVLASNFGGMAELVSDGKDGLLFQVNDEIDLARKISRLLDDPNLASQLSAGIDPVKSVDQEITEIEQLFRQLTVPMPFKQNQVSG